MEKETKQSLYNNKEVLMKKYNENIKCFEEFSVKELNIASNRRYYAFLQFLKYNVVKYMEFDPFKNYGVGDSKKSSHINMFECFLNGINLYIQLRYGKYSKEAIFEERVLKGFMANFDSIKNIRQKADYYAEDISNTEFNKIKDICDKFERKINKYIEEGVLNE